MLRGWDPRENSRDGTSVTLLAFFFDVMARDPRDSPSRL